MINDDRDKYTDSEDRYILSVVNWKSNRKRSTTSICSVKTDKQ